MIDESAPSQVDHPEIVVSICRRNVTRKLAVRNDPAEIIFRWGSSQSAWFDHTCYSPTHAVRSAGIYARKCQALWIGV